jgi:hypothetical protein
MKTLYALPSELKFIVSRNLAAEIREWARKELEPDPYAVAGDGYQTTSLYFDTDEFDTFFGRLSYARAKYRIRRYNNSSIVFLERKLKTGSRVAKRRSQIHAEDLGRFARGTAWEEQWFWRRLQHRRLQPVCQIAYKRTARVGEALAGPLRLTIDDEVTGTTVGRIEFSDRVDAELLPDQSIVELKYRLHVPVVFKRLIQEFQLQSMSFSKYRLAVKAMRIAGDAQGMIVHA